MKKTSHNIFNKIQKTMVLFMCLMLMMMGMLSGCSGSSADSVADAKKPVVMTIGEYDITLDQLNLYLIQYAFNNFLKSADVDEIKNTQVINATVNQIKVETVQYLLALEMELELSDEEMQKAKSSAETFYNHYGEEFLSKYGIDKQSVEDLFVRQVYIVALNDKATDDLKKDYQKQYEENYADVPFHSISYALFPSIQYDENGQPVMENDDYVDLTEEELKEQKNKAEELCKKAHEGEALEDLIKEYEIEPYSGVERNYEGAYAEELNDIVKQLEEGEVSEVIETEAGYMVARMDKKNDLEYKEYLISYMAEQSAQALLPTMQDGWIKQAGVSDIAPTKEVLDNLKLKEMCKEMEEKELY